MKRVKFLSTILGSTLLILAAACSNDDNKTTDKEQVNAAQAIEFKVDFADYNAEQDVNVTRAGNQEVKLEQQTVDLGNGIWPNAYCNATQPSRPRQPKRALWLMTHIRCWPMMLQRMPIKVTSQAR